MNLTFSTALIICLFLSSGIKAQTQKETKVKPVLFDGFLVTGYVDNGAYINCTGPGVRFTKTSRFSPSGPVARAENKRGQGTRRST